MKKRRYRLFGVINPLDVLFAAGLAALVWAAYAFSVPRDVAAVGGTRIRYTIELANNEEGFYQTIRAGTPVRDSIHGIYIGTVVYAYGRPFTLAVPDEGSNIIRSASVEGREFTYIVMEAWADICDYATAIGQYHIRVGQQIFTRSLDFGGEGIVTALEVVR